jgi:VPDSG-CTERM motif
VKKQLTITAAAIAFACAFGSNAYALTINDPGVVGVVGVDSTIDPLTATIHLLGMTASQSDPSGCSITTNCYQTSSTDYVGTVTAVAASGSPASAGVTLPSGGYDYILVKYDGAEAGYVLYYVGGLSGTLVFSPSYPLWDPNTTNQYSANNWYAFNCTDDTCGGGPTFVTPDGGSTVTLLGSVLFALGMFARKFRKA